MPNTEVFQDLIRDANPVPDTDHLHGDELDRFVALTATRRAAMTPGPTQNLQQPEGPDGRRRGWSNAMALVGAFAAVLLTIGLGALFLRGEEPATDDSTAVAVTTATPEVTAPTRTTATVEPEAATVGPETAAVETEAMAAPTGGTPLPDFAAALPGDDGAPPAPLGAITAIPNNTRLDFLFEFCWPNCFRDAHFIDPNDPSLGSGVWTAGRPFHVRHGFRNDGDAPLAAGHSVVLYVTPMDQPGEFGGRAIAETYRYTPDYVLRGTTDQCGPTYETQIEPASCEWFVHDFTEGLPAGRHAIWAVWEAPCSSWLDLGFTESCNDPNEVVSMFSSGFDALYDGFEPSFTEPSDAGLTPDEIESRFGEMDAMEPLFTPIDPTTVSAAEVAAFSDALPPESTNVIDDPSPEREKLGVRDELPDSARLDFLATLCDASCYRDAHVMETADAAMGHGRWAADVPFHIRHGFVNESAPLSEDFEVVVSITRRSGPELDDGAFPLDQPYRFSSDFVLRGSTTKCGPAYWDQTTPESCEWFVHDFPDGLPSGRYDLWAEWYAPCSAWLDLGLVDSCAVPSEVTTEFAGSVNMPFLDGPDPITPLDPSNLHAEPILFGAEVE